ncbi:hypothetical protein RJD11_12135 [Bacillus velezensis]|uniref:hypothetical protein n=1 Tax=Bacillus TaxID=1386 RepID=UPI001E313312|nr:MULTISPECIES: hypothetical protein [Bacillus amyloliquefaciens group]UHH01341.1 hypothetical protein LUA14_12060 [Bacillus amyloliquefaciens]ULR21089.1 hypothetical protein MJE83_12060 [Bacillus velezensis]UVW07832.1 hypothetical protein NX856_12100 [Bacillus velezensis]WHL75138.1 hypothetical protein QLH34_12080 [Bacillus velezensis]WNP87098.1 hypothetical protein RJD11_12135 [Bacillus velezensis]
MSLEEKFKLMSEKTALQRGNSELKYENEKLQERCIELETRNEDLARTIKKQNKMIRGQNWRILFFALSWVVYGAVSAMEYFWG